MGGTTDRKSWELKRFASKLDYSVVGGASRLLKHFITKYNPSKIVSLADLRWSNGNVYRGIGFQEKNIVPPRYHYTADYQTLEHRFQFRKSRLGETQGRTEWDIMQERGYDRIWDCGKINFVWER
jgi:hypothetical protein